MNLFFAWLLPCACVMASAKENEYVKEGEYRSEARNEGVNFGSERGYRRLL